MMRDQKCKRLNENLSFHHVQGIIAQYIVSTMTMMMSLTGIFVSFSNIAANPCRLACRSGHSYSFYGNIDDGVRCNHLDASVYDVCLEGECQVKGSPGDVNSLCSSYHRC